LLFIKNGPALKVLSTLLPKVADGEVDAIVNLVYYSPKLEFLVMTFGTVLTGVGAALYTIPPVPANASVTNEPVGVGVVVGKLASCIR